MFGRYADRIPGGIQEHVSALCRALHGTAQVVVLVPKRGDMPSYERNEFCEIYRSGSVFEAASVSVSPAMVAEARRLHRRTPFDLVHLHFPDPMSHLASWALPRAVPRVITWHSDIVRQRWLRVLYRPFLEHAISSAAAVVAATPAHFSSSTVLARRADSAKFRVVPYGFDFSRFDEVPDRAHALRDAAGGRTLIFALGRHVYYKGFEYLVRAMATVENALLVLGGSGPLTPALRRLVQRSGVADRVQLTGHIADEHVPAYYHACDIFCLPSVEPAEAFGIAQLEAMACGKPVVCCRLNNGVNYLNLDGETGLAVPPRDAAALAAALNRLGADPRLRESLGARGRSRARTEYSLGRMREAILRVYDEALRAARPVHPL